MKKGAKAGRAAGARAVSLKAWLAQVNRWREQYNPLLGLVLARAEELRLAAQRGEYADLQWAFKHIEERFPVLVALVERRVAPLLEMDWDVVQMPEEDLPEGCTPEMAEAQARVLRSRYQQIDNLTEGIEHLGMASFRGFAHLQKQDRDGDGRVDHLEVLDQWNFVRAGLNGNWWFNPGANSVGWQGLSPANEIRSLQTATGQSDIGLRRGDFVIREVKRPIDMVAMDAFIRWAMGKKNRSGFVEIFGIPGGVVIGPPNVPPDKESDYQEAGQQIAEGGTGYLPNGSDYKCNDSPRSTDPFQGFLDDELKDVVLAGTGGLLTMLAESGSGTLAGSAHMEAFKQLARATGMKISEALQRDFDAEVLAEEFPGQPVLAYFRLLSQDETAARTLEFKREVFKGFMSDGTVSDVLANQTDLKQLTKDVELPVNEEYVDPYLPVETQGGALVSGELVKDEEGDVIGAESIARGTPGPGGRPPEDGGQRTEDGSLQTATTEDEDESDAQEGPGGRPPLKNREGSGELARAMAADLEPALERLWAILGIQDDAVFGRKLQEFWREFEGLKADLLADPSAARALQPLIERGVLEGMREGGPVANRKILNGDLDGHPFRGNQWTNGGAMAASAAALGHGEAAHGASGEANQGNRRSLHERAVTAHRTASDAHRTAAEGHKAVGNLEQAKRHLKLAKQHERFAGGHQAVLDNKPSNTWDQE